MEGASVDTQDIEMIMKNFHSEIGSEKLSELMVQFTGDKSSMELFKLMWNLEEAHHHFTPKLLTEKKSSDESERFRSEGNKFYKQRNFDKALELYNRSIMTAPHPKISNKTSKMKQASNESDKSKHEKVDQENTNPCQEGEYSALAFGYANRSAVLLEMQIYEKCLEDIKLALSHGYPKSLQAKLEERKERCQTAKSKNWKFNPNLLPEDCKSAEYILLGTYENQKSALIEEANPLLPSFSNSVKVAYSPDKGRHIIATKDIPPGDVIAVEECYCSSLELEKMSSYCSCCLKQCLTPIPCPSCSVVIFCSEQCRDKALTGDHWLECLILPTLNVLGLKPVFTMVYKLLKHSSHIKWKTTLEDLQEKESQCLPEELGLNEKGVYSPADYESVYHLVTNKERRPNGDLYVKCMISFILTDLLKQSGRYFVDFFGQPFNPGTEDLLMIGDTLFSNLMKTSCNGFQLVEFQCTGLPITLNRVAKGSAVFPTLSLVNHSCDPTATPYINGRVQTLRAARYISAGDEVTENYCKTFYMEGQEQRQMGLLEVYQFTCNCEACQKNWQTYHELPKEAQFKCVNCSRSVNAEAPICANCKLDYTKHDYDANKQILVDEWWANVKQVQEAFEKSKFINEKFKISQPLTEDDLILVRNAVEVMDKSIQCPCQPLWDVYDIMDLYFRVKGDPVWGYLHDYYEL